MNKLILIGNGFDLAHNLPTRYQDFLMDLFIANFYRDNQFFTFKRDELDGEYQLSPDSFYEKFIEQQHFGVLTSKKKIIFHNNFLEQLYRTISKNKFWVDIEKEYFSMLYKMSPANATSLNDKFNEIKSELEEYLTKITKKKSIINKKFFDIFLEGNNSEEIYFLNFNYTGTLDYYSTMLNQHYGINSRIINIHGKINDPMTPIIFGYGDESDPRYHELKEKDESAYLDNIKSIDYNEGYNEVIRLIENPITVQIVGHSCGID